MNEMLRSSMTGYMPIFSATVHLALCRASTVALPWLSNCAASRMSLKITSPMVKDTGGQRIDLVGIPKEELPEVPPEGFWNAFRSCLQKLPL